MAFFESFSYFLSKLHGENKQIYCQIQNVYEQLILDTDYLDTLTHSVDSGKQTEKRYEIINRFIHNMNL